MSHPPPQMQKPSTWAEKVRVTYSSIRCSFEQLARQHAGNALKIPKEMKMANKKLWSKLSTKSSIENIMAKGPWLFGGKTMILQKWYPGFYFDKKKSSLPVWVRLKGLPFPLWNKQGLSMTASMAGKPIAYNEHTLNYSRSEYARVCVEMDAFLPFIHQFFKLRATSHKSR
ncbi:hypothetical protein OIU77_019560 [Salix suchowensis]|uniref:DUF4283 domain-containing protein n=1 Tax=Salix suchowensis TaxID=1278906 RepID=A0ABQ9CK15_9ROSI|nr:hypothetical protein OIU77_019560 [Salix suchowensis]